MMNAFDKIIMLHLLFTNSYVSYINKKSTLYTRKIKINNEINPQENLYDSNS